MTENSKDDLVQRQLCGFVVALHKALMKYLVAARLAFEVMSGAVADTEPMIRYTKWIKPV